MKKVEDSPPPATTWKSNERNKSNDSTSSPLPDTTKTDERKKSTEVQTSPSPQGDAQAEPRKLSNNSASGSQKDEKDGRRGENDSNKKKDIKAIVKVDEVEESSDSEEEEEDEYEIQERPKTKHNWPNMIYSDNLIQSISVYIRMMQVLLRFPVFLKRQRKSGIYQFRFKCMSILSFGYVISSICVVVEFLLVCHNSMSILLNSPTQSHNNYTLISPGSHRNEEVHLVSVSRYELRAHELYIFQKNLVAVVIILAILTHCVNGNINFFMRRHFLCSYYTFWARAVEIMDINAAGPIQKFAKKLLFVYVCFLLTLTILHIIRFSPICTGAPATLSLLTFRVFLDDIFLKTYFWIVRGFSGVVFVFLMVNSKSFIILFIWTCKLLQNSILAWNDRAERVLNQNENLTTRKEKVKNRTGFDHLFKDHVCILDLIDGADVIFRNIIESYYLTNVVSMAFEFFFLYRSQSEPKEFPGYRRYDGVPMFLFGFHSLIFLYMACRDASEVAEHSLQGLEIIRRKALLGRQSDEQLYFVLSLYVSYTGHFDMALSGARMFVIDKSFLVSISLLFFTLFIIIVQFTPNLIMTDEVKLGRINITVELLDRIVEGTVAIPNLERISQTFDEIDPADIPEYLLPH